MIHHSMMQASTPSTPSSGSHAPDSNAPARVVLVTGGTKGIGREIAQAFLTEGCEVVVCARNAPATLPAAGGREASFLACDVREAEALKALVAQVVQAHGRLDVLVNNAGGAPMASAATASPRFHEGVLRLNLMGPLHAAQAANAQMQQQAEGGVIVFIGSVSGLRPSPGTAAYGAAKAAVVSLVSSLAVEWAPKVRVVAVSPGMVLTEQSHLHYGNDEGIAAVAATVPAGRLATGADVAQACLWVASPQASYFSGGNLVLHGGGEKPAFLSAAQPAPVAKTASPATTAHTTQEAPGG
jgi:NAD(P)-dependent dehydrogenase (short-subunit alcohol dehydrogenase family)